ncbi:MAG: hypothetical protein KatS3mg031_0876 [Chitinophagales bacterium]|nr:MAG: hypothetical protein KatS3mg031_0876 [Chitinophagales bacterium]
MWKAVIILWFLQASPIWAQQFQWVKTGSSIGQDAGQSITVGPSGAIYATGSFSDKAIFSGREYSGQGIFEIYIAKYSPEGDLLWLKTAGSYQNDEGLGIATDSDENIYVAGYFSQTCLFGSGSHTVTLVSEGNTDIFLAKYTANGDLVWAQRAGGPKEDRATNLKIDNYNNIYITGYFSDHSFFGTHTLTAQGSTDAFTARYDGSGFCIWAHGLGGVGLDKALGLAVDTFGNVYATGFFYYGAFLSNAPATLLADGNSSDIFVVAYNFSGDNILAERLGGPFNDAAYALAVDHQKNIYITGYFLDEITFGSFYMNSYGYDDIFIVKYDSTFTAEWAIHEGSVHLDIGMGITVDQQGNIYVAGMFDSVGYFGQDTLFSQAYYDVFISKYNSKGILLWVRHAGGPEGDFARSLCIAPDGSLYLTGYYRNIAYFDMHATPFSRENDIFIAKLSQPFTSSAVATSPPEPFSFSVYPNPSSGQFYISPASYHRESEVFSLRMFDISGKLILQQKVKYEGQAAYLISVSPFSPGTYQLQLQNSAISHTQKIVLF